jgi:hypothetical protein
MTSSAGDGGGTGSRETPDGDGTSEGGGDASGYDGGDAGGTRGFAAALLDMLGVVRESGPRTAMFAAGIVLLLSAVVLRRYAAYLVGAGILVFLIPVVDLARGGTIAD